MPRTTPHARGPKLSPSLVIAAILSVASPAPLHAILTSSSPQTAAADPALTDRLARARAAMLAGTGLTGDLIAELKAILALNPALAEAHLLLGLAYRSIASNAMLPEAIAEFRQAIALDPTLTAGRFYLARAYLDLNRAERAREELLLALADAPGQTQFMTLLAEAERRSGNPARALELADQVLSTTPSSVEARYFSAMALRDLGRQTEAITRLEQLTVAGVQAANVAGTLGMAYLDVGRIDDAIKMLTVALEAAPARPDLRVSLARALRLAGRPDDALEQLALALPPGAQREASEFYETVQADINFETGLVRLQQGRLDEAIVELTQALELRPADGPTHRHLAEAHLRQGRRELAASHAATARDAGEPLPDELVALLPAAAPVP